MRPLAPPRPPGCACRQYIGEALMPETYCPIPSHRAAAFAQFGIVEPAPPQSPDRTLRSYGRDALRAVGDFFSRAAPWLGYAAIWAVVLVSLFLLVVIFAGVFRLYQVFNWLISFLPGPA